MDKVFSMYNRTDSAKKYAFRTRLLDTQELYKIYIYILKTYYNTVIIYYRTRIGNRQDVLDVMVRE